MSLLSLRRGVVALEVALTQDKRPTKGIEMNPINVTHILDLFTEVINERSGKILESFRHNERAFSRALLPSRMEVKANDQLQAGVALKGAPVSLAIHPFVFRQVCSNGCVFGKSIQSRKLNQVGHSYCLEMNGKVNEVVTGLDVDWWFKDSVAGCCKEEVFSNTSNTFRLALQHPFTGPANVEQALMGSLNLEKFPGAKEYHAKIMKEYLAQDEPVLFNLINAVTAVARDLHDAEKKWKLECVAGDLAWLLSKQLNAPMAHAKASPVSSAGRLGIGSIGA